MRSATTWIPALASKPEFETFVIRPLGGSFSLKPMRNIRCPSCVQTPEQPRVASRLAETKQTEERTHEDTIKSFILSAALAALALPLGAQAQTIHHRKENQQRRIGQGVKSGQMTAHETAHVEHQEAHLNRETRHMRAAERRQADPGEKAKVNRQQNHLSHEIYRDKHNNRVQ